MTLYKQSPLDSPLKVSMMYCWCVSVDAEERRPVDSPHKGPVMQLTLSVSLQNGDMLSICFAFILRPGGWFNIKMPSYQYRKSHYGDKTICWPSYLHNGISYTGKMASLYWIRAQELTLLVLDTGNSQMTIALLSQTAENTERQHFHVTMTHRVTSPWRVVDVFMLMLRTDSLQCCYLLCSGCLL